jgi:hypothetical protein
MSFFLTSKNQAKIRGRTYPLFEDIISYPYPGPKKGYYILSITRPKKRIWIYILYPLSNFLPAHKSSTFYQIELKPWSISSAARKWQITAEIAETAVLKEKSFLWNPKSRALNVEKRI